MAASNFGSCWPLETPSSLPPCSFEAGSTESFLATADHFSPPSTRLLGLERLGLVLGQDHLEVAALGLRELLLVLVVVVLDLAVGDVLAALGDLLADLVREHVEPDAEQEVLLGLAGGLQEALVGLLVRERLVLGLLELALDLGVGVALTPRSFASPSIHFAETRNCITCCLTASYCLLPGFGGAAGFFWPGCGCDATTVSQWSKSVLGDRAGVVDVGDVARLPRRRAEDRMAAIASATTIAIRIAPIRRPAGGVDPGLVRAGRAACGI